MLVTLFALGSMCLAPAPTVAVVSDSLAPLYQSGRTWAEFFEAAKSRKEMWRDNYDRGAPLPEAVERARAVGGHWKVLAVAEDWCGDSANTIPYLARLVEQVPGLELRIVNSTVGKWVMERHKTADGRPATPTVVLLDESGGERGCFIERPPELRTWVAENKPKLADSEFQTAKMAWYKNDRGQSTVTEFIAILEAASHGTSRCGNAN